MVPEERTVREADLVPPVEAHLARQGYRVWAAPDGADYFDIVARRGGEVGLVELKVADWRKVFAQAVRRRAWADWVAVALPRASLARRLLDRPTAPRAERIGVWVVATGSVRELRAARPLVGAGEADPFSESRALFRARLDELAAGAIPAGARWLVPGRPRTGAARRTIRDWRLEEFPDGG